jgi:ATP-binding cassette subfamily C protein/ATP-binding cassette subfamily C protein EexD
MRLPQGYETEIGDGGMRLSGGQRQRLGLARAFFGNPRLIVLDEPNASLDAEGEDALRQAIREMRERGSTVILIAQRLGILNLADKILVLDSGRMDAFGSRRDVSERIRGGRTCLRVRQPQVIAGGKSISRLRSEPAANAVSVATAWEEAGWAAS